MGKRIISQRRGRGTLTYKVKKKAFTNRIGYPSKEGEAEIFKIFHSPAHTAPLMKLKIDSEVFINPAFNNAFIGQKIAVGVEKSESGNIVAIKHLL